MSGMDWRSTEFRRRIIAQLDEAFKAYPQLHSSANSMQLETAAFNRSNTSDDYIRNIKSILMMFKKQQHQQQQQQHQQLQQQQQQQQAQRQVNVQQHGSYANQFREHQIQSLHHQMMEPHAPSYPMMPQQPQQQPQLDQNRTFLAQDQSQQQQQQHQMFDGGLSARSNMASGSLGAHSTGLMKQGPTANINTMGGPATTVGSMSSTMQASVPSFSVAPQPMPVDGSTVTAHYGPSTAQQRPPFGIHNYPTSGTSLPASQGMVDPTMSAVMSSPFSQPSPGSPATSAEEEQYQQKKAELSQYIPTVMKVINKYTSRGTPEDAQRLQQVSKLRDFVRMLQDSTRRIPLSALQKWEIALKKIFPSTNLEPPISEPTMPGMPSTIMHPPSGQPPSIASSQVSTAPVSTRAPQLELQSTNSPTLSYTTPIIRESQLTLQLMCKQQQKNNSGGLKSSLLVQRELDYLENYFKLSSQEIDTKENCIVLKCSLEGDYLPATLPPLTIRIPDNYPAVPPEYVMEDNHNSIFLLSVEKYLVNQLTNMSMYSVTQLLHIWEASVRNAVRDVIATSM